MKCNSRLLPLSIAAAALSLGTKYAAQADDQVHDENGNLQKAPITVYGFKADMPTPLQ
ncbi:MAG: hypothetical protein ABIR55_16495 [Burkholderiaceae bacterium]